MKILVMNIYIFLHYYKISSENNISAALCEKDKLSHQNEIKKDRAVILSFYIAEMSFPHEI